MALDTRVLNEASAEEFVKRNKNARWEGWDIVIHTPQKFVWRKPEARFNRGTGKWGVEQRVSPSNDGTWTVTIPAPWRK